MKVCLLATRILASSSAAFALVVAAPSAMARVGMQPGQPGPMPAVLTLPGNDSCSTPDPISGNGFFYFDNRTATTGSEGQTEALCAHFGSTAIYNDVWFLWTAPYTGTATWDLCGSSVFGTKIAVYATTSCPTPGTCIACDTDYCTIQSRVLFPTTAGSSYLLQLGNSGATPSLFAGWFALYVPTLAPPANDDCASAITLLGAGPFALDTDTATTSSQQFGSCGTAEYDIWYDWTAPATGTCMLSLCGDYAFVYDSLVNVYDGSGCPTSAAIGCNDDFCGVMSQATFPCTAGNHYMLQLGGVGGNGMGLASFTLHVGPATYLCDPGLAGVTTCPCNNPPASAGRGCENTTGTYGAFIEAGGDAKVLASTLTFTSHDTNSNAFAVLIQGSALIASGAHFGHGVRCVGGTVLRMYVKPSTGGSATFPGALDPDIATRSANLGHPIVAGTTRWYGVYYRDASSIFGGCVAPTGYNITNTAAVLWQ